MATPPLSLVPPSGQQSPDPAPAPSSEELARRLTVEVARLATLPAIEVQLYLATEDYLARYGVDSSVVKKMVEAAVKENEKKRKEEQADTRYEQRRAEQKQERAERRTRQDEIRDRKEAELAAERARKEAERIEAARLKREAIFAEIADLPKLTHETRLREAAVRLGEDFDDLVQEFEVYLAARAIPEDLEPWPDPVDTAGLLTEIETKFRRYVVVSDAAVTAIVLWVLFTYLIEITTHAPKLFFTSPVKDAGKSTGLHVVRWMSQRSYAAVEATGAVLYRIIDRLKPTLFLDEADTLFQRRTALAHIINESWTNSGSKIRRARAGGKGYDEYDVYGAQLIGMKGLRAPDTTLSRCIICRFLPKLPTEVVEDFGYTDDGEFKTIRRKLMRWAIDNAVTLCAAKPEFPPGFNNRVKTNWKMLLAITDLAGGKWPKRARDAAQKLETGRDEPSEIIRLVGGVCDVWGGAKVPVRTSESLCTALAAHPSGEWADFRGKGPISQHQLAAIFRIEFDIRPFTGHPTGRSDVTRGPYRYTQFEPLFARLLQKPSPDSNTQTLEPPKPPKGRKRKDV
jgi:hypothetical protein